MADTALDRGVTILALQTPIWWPLHWIGTPIYLFFPKVEPKRVSWRGNELILCHGRRMADNALGLVTMPSVEKGSTTLEYSSRD